MQMNEDLIKQIVDAVMAQIGQLENNTAAKTSATVPSLAGRDRIKPDKTQVSVLCKNFLELWLNLIFKTKSVILFVIIRKIPVVPPIAWSFAAFMRLYFSASASMLFMPINAL